MKFFPHNITDLVNLFKSWFNSPKSPTKQYHIKSRERGREKSYLKQMREKDHQLESFPTILQKKTRETEWDRKKKGFGRRRRHLI